MTCFVDASVIVAILGMEPGWQEFADRLEQHERPRWSAMVQWEAVAALRTRLNRPFADVRSIVLAFAADVGLDMVEIGQREGSLAQLALQQYGKGTGHRAQLNMGDCFAYACAKANGAALLYKGDDFAHTDLA